MGVDDSTALLHACVSVDDSTGLHHVCKRESRVDAGLNICCGVCVCVF